MSHEHHTGHHHGHDMMQSQGSTTTTTMATMADHSGHGGHSSHGSSGPQGMHGMAMYFHLGFEQYVLLEQWSAQTVTSMVIACLVFFLLAITYEVLKAYRRVVALRFQLGQAARIVQGGSTGHGRHHGQTGPEIIMGSGGDSAGSSLSAHSSNNGHQKLVPSSTGTSSMYVVDPASPTPDDPTVQVMQPHACHPSYGLHGANAEQGSTAPVLAASPGIPLFSTLSEMYSVAHLASTMLYMLQVLLAYILMLAFMLFNVWICLAILLGAAFGHFLLAHKQIALQDSANEDHCH